MKVESDFARWHHLRNENEYYLQGADVRAGRHEAQHRDPGLAQLLAQAGGRQHQGLRGHDQERWGRQDGAPRPQGDPEVP